MQASLAILDDRLNDIFEAFYRRLLSDSHFSVFFRDDAHVRSLVVRQRENVRQAIQEDVPTIRRRYTELGRFHHRIFVPFVDFAVGVDFLAAEFLDKVAEERLGADVARDVYAFFQLIKDYTARGYLTCMLEDDRRDLDLFINSLRDSREITSGLIGGHLAWLKQVLDAIEREREDLLPDVDLERSAFHHWLVSGAAEPYLPGAEERRHLLDLNRRIFTDASNLFYFVRHHHYMEVMMIYDKINKYILTANNIVTVLITRLKMKELMRDPLTHLYDRTTLEDTLSQALELARLARRPFSVVMVDIDDFKQVNDTYGHLAGDCVLGHVAEVIRRYIRSTDYAFRYGGEEFLLVLNDTPLQGGALLADKVRETIAETVFRCDGTELHVTASFGVAEMPGEQGADLGALVSRADQKLYEAKRAGKNRVAS